MKKTPAKILLIATRRLGDVLLTTPLIRSLRRTYPDAVIDVLVFHGTGAILAANPDINQIIACTEGASALASLKDIFPLARRYDLAVSTLAGDRPTFYAWLAGKYRIGTLEKNWQNSWKRLLLNKWEPFDDQDTHTAKMGLKIAALLGIDPIGDVVVAWSHNDAMFVTEALKTLGGNKFVVLHPYPKFRYKMWSEQGWVDLVKWLQEQGMAVMLTGSADTSEMAYVKKLLLPFHQGVFNLAGRFSLSQTGCLLSRASFYVGVDTVVTHMAAALGVPTLALYGPTNPVKWGPLPKGHSTPLSPFVRHGVQKRGNVFLLQKDLPCVPCYEEGCGRNIESVSECLEKLPVSAVIEAVQKLLGIEKYYPNQL